MINNYSIVVGAEEVVETEEIKLLRELREKVNNLEKRLIDIDILEQKVIEKVKNFDFFTMILQVFNSFMIKNTVEKDIVKITLEKTVIKEKKYPDDLLCGCKASYHYGKTYKEIKQSMDNENYDFHAWEKRCPVNWVENVN
jgi:hypothetical protein